MQSLFCVNGPKLHILRFRDGYCDAQMARMGAEPPLLRSVGWQIQCTHLLAHSIRLVRLARITQTQKSLRQTPPGWLALRCAGRPVFDKAIEQPLFTDVFGPV